MLSENMGGISDIRGTAFVGALTCGVVRPWEQDAWDKVDTSQWNLCESVLPARLGLIKSDWKENTFPEAIMHRGLPDTSDPFNLQQSMFCHRVEEKHLVWGMSVHNVSMPHSLWVTRPLPSHLHFPPKCFLTHYLEGDKYSNWLNH